jgi:hypothetical protein
MNGFLTIFTRLALGRFYVFQPMARRYRLSKIVRCPETDQAAEVLLNAYPSATSKAKKEPSIRKCSLWPSRRGCTERCLSQAAGRSGR